MSDAIEISQIVISPLVSREPPGKAPPDVEWYALEVLVKNTSALPMCVISEIRRLRYDAERRLLVVGLTEDDTAETRGVVDLPEPPSYTVIEPGEQRTLTNRLSSPITWVEESFEGLRRPVHVWIEQDVDTIECVVAYNAEPLAPRNLAAIEAPAQRPRWALASRAMALRGDR